MKLRLLSRIQALEEAAGAPPIDFFDRMIRYGWIVKPLPDDFQGEKHRVVVKEDSDPSGFYRWCQWEERPGPAPARDRDQRSDCDAPPSL